MNYEISVVIPMYNASRTIERALLSIENQIGASFKEIIVIDDGSTDDSFDLVKAYKLQSSLNIIIFKQKNSGVSSARNLGIDKATGDYIAFLDSDDEWAPNKTKDQMVFFKVPDVVMVGGNHFELPRSGMATFEFIDSKKQLLKNHFQTSTVIVSRAVIQLFGGFFKKQKHAEEGRFYFDVLKHGRAILLNKPVVVYDGGNKPGFGHSGLSSNIFAMQRGEICNILYAHKIHNISTTITTLAIIYSCMKFIRRSIIVLRRKYIIDL